MNRATKFKSNSLWIGQKAKQDIPHSKFNSRKVVDGTRNYALKRKNREQIKGTFQLILCQHRFIYTGRKILLYLQSS
jgi:hypothetical protein